MGIQQKIDKVDKECFGLDLDQYERIEAELNLLYEDHDYQTARLAEEDHNDSGGTDDVRVDIKDSSADADGPSTSLAADKPQGEQTDIQKPSENSPAKMPTFQLARLIRNTSISLQSIPSDDFILSYGIFLMYVDPLDQASKTLFPLMRNVWATC